MTSADTPRWLVQDSEGTLHGYWSYSILMCDLRLNRGEQPKLFRLVCAAGTRRYYPTTEQEIREREETPNE